MGGDGGVGGGTVGSVHYSSSIAVFPNDDLK